MSGIRLTDADELLYRQVHPNWIRDGRPTRQAFRPSRKDNSKLSVDRESLTSAEDAFDLHTKKRGLLSAGIWAFEVADCSEASLPVYEDPIASPPDPVADPAHAVVDFGGLSNGSQEAKAAQLGFVAEMRGRVFPPPDDDQIPFNDPP